MSRRACLTQFGRVCCNNVVIYYFTTLLQHEIIISNKYKESYLSNCAIIVSNQEACMFFDNLSSKPGLYMCSCVCVFCVCVCVRACDRACVCVCVRAVAVVFAKFIALPT